jgi:hypothetical protein
MSEVRPPSYTKAQCSKVAEFILRLQEDLKFLAEFNKDHDKVMIDAGIISEEVRNTIKNGDEAMIRRLLAADEAAGTKDEK